MKKLFMVATMVAMLLFASGSVMAMDWVNVPVKVAWDGSAIYEDGTPILPTEGVITYDVVIKNMSTGVAAPIVNGISTTEQEINVSERGRWAIGIRAVLTDEDSVAYSDYAWSDVVVDCEGGKVFAVKIMGKPVKPNNMRVVLDAIIGWFKQDKRSK